MCARPRPHLLEAPKPNASRFADAGDTFEVPISESVFALLSQHAQWNFDDLLDYVWKAPTLIDVLESTERAQLSEFTTARARNERWEWESRKLERAFPQFLAQGNLLLAVSLLEYQVFRMTRLALRLAGRRSHPRGADALFATLRQLGIHPEKVDLWPQIQAAIKLRNCVAHASGLLAYSGEATELRRIVRSRTYLAAHHRRSESPDTELGVTLESMAAGEALKVHNTYAWLAVAYARDYFIGLCMAAFERFPGEDTFEEQVRLTLRRRPRLRVSRPDTA